ncbi:MAG: hypothetical protein L0I29_00240 [Hyphomicrobiales bacterium]|nr:hypothetical protein [Hyphomicrobiales bacterium]
MDTTKLVRAYHSLIAAAEGIDKARQLNTEDRTEIEWRLCHIALSDEILAAAVEKTLAGEPAVVDNKPAMDRAAIAFLTARTNHDERVASMKYNGAAFASAAEKLSEHQSRSMVRLIAHNRNGIFLSDSEMSWYDLIILRAERHLPSHTTFLTNAR